jgi:uncharacterized membrane protein YhaH (DUF805 family)
MNTDKFWMSALWGRIGAALILIVGTMLQSMGVDVTKEQMDSAHGVIDTLIQNIHVVVAAIMVVFSKLRERSRGKKLALAVGQTGAVSMVAIICAIGIMVTHCAHHSATQQIRTQTSDPAAIALATFADAQDAYIAAAELYQPYQAALRTSNPALDAEVVGYLRAAEKILADWEVYGDVPLGDKQAFRNYLREISIRTARLIEEGK